ncbi:hypothetical protein RHMOL_Rhmol10G0001600 [Rhododendron molle]|uniref:Uncharacterized protein n=1 Tax=Rhododendron molle TaxID=49168 RepID=A0ACC0LXC9_RHOML|nr:hypothetical protein RHMOL_Rhmol10G0001600 [Rhododendron molle]
MADMEIVLVAVVDSLDIPKADLWVMFAILSTVIGYCAKTHFTQPPFSFVSHEYMLYFCIYIFAMFSPLPCFVLLKPVDLIVTNQLFQWPVKEVVVAFFVLMEQGKATQQDLDLHCEELIKDEFGKSCNFEVDDAVQKLEKLGIVSRDTIGRYNGVGLKRANEIIGVTTEELVLEAKQSASGP